MTHTISHYLFFLKWNSHLFLAWSLLSLSFTTRLHCTFLLCKLTLSAAKGHFHYLCISSTLSLWDIQTQGNLILQSNKTRLVASSWSVPRALGVLALTFYTHYKVNSSSPFLVYRPVFFSPVHMLFSFWCNCTFLFIPQRLKWWALIRAVHYRIPLPLTSHNITLVCACARTSFPSVNHNFFHTYLRRAYRVARGSRDSKTNV